MSPFCAEIVYGSDGSGWVHSDICWHHDSPVSDRYRALLHECLDEWLDKGRGSGTFVLGIQR